jgi:ribosomal protein S18 acetylase RimI-like enzyme
MEISIRPAGDRDIEALCEMYYEFHEFHVRGVPTHLRSLGDRERWDRSYLREALGKIIQSDDAEVFVAEVAGKLAGLVEVYVRQDADEATLVQHRYAELQSVMVLSPFRRNGVGIRLVGVARQWARDKGATEMRLGVWEFNEAARAFYEALGFKTLKRRMVAELPA